MAVERLVFYRGNRLFTKKFALSQDGNVFDINLLTSPITILWWFLTQDKKTKKFLTWTGVATGVNNEEAPFIVTDGFFDTNVVYDCQIEVFDNTNLLVHSEDIFEVEIKEPVGVHTDT